MPPWKPEETFALFQQAAADKNNLLAQVAYIMYLFKGVGTKKVGQNEKLACEKGKRFLKSTTSLQAYEDNEWYQFFLAHLFAIRSSLPSR